MAWILTFVVNASYPFIWLGDYTRLASVIPSGRQMIFYFYSSCCLFFTLLVQFIVLVLVITKNENVRKNTKYIIHKNEDTINGKTFETPKEKEEALDAANKQSVNTNNYIQTTSQHLVKRDKIIKKLYVTNTVLIWCMVSYMFSIYLKPNNAASFEVGGPISWWISSVLFLAERIDFLFKGFFSSILVPPLVKAFIVFCISFISILFSFFLRIPKKSLSKSSVDAYRIKNIDSPFPRKFERRIRQYKDLTMFFFASFLSLLCFLMLGGIHTWLNGSKYIYQGIGALISVILFVVLFKEKNKILSSTTKVKEMIYFFLC
jgi:hypothetical protein